MDISKIDKNFLVCSFEDEDACWYDASSYPFDVYGVLEEDGAFRRLPAAVADNVNDGVSYLAANSAGGRVRFKTDSPFIAVKAQLYNVGKMPHFTLCGSAGFDLYCDDEEYPEYAGTFMPPFDLGEEYSAKLDTDGNSLHSYTVNLPLYSGVKKLYIGVKKGSRLQSGRAYKDVKPVVYYGSSITQGGCASRPGTAYQAEISRRTDIDFINLGFSGSARGETLMAEYIASLDMSVFVMDYDHNAPSEEHLKNTHLPFYRIIREAHPGLPVIFVTAPALRPTPWYTGRREIIRSNYEQLLKGGDNVYFVDGGSFFAQPFAQYGTVDGSHPNDFGFYQMAEKIGAAVSEALKQQ